MISLLSMAILVCPERIYSRITLMSTFDAS